MGTDSRAKAQWIKERQGDIVEWARPWFHTCSACGVEIMEGDYDNYCPNCGAKMGEWAQPWTVSYISENEYIMRCPDCEAEIETVSVTNLKVLLHTYKFCPKCGNKRKGDKLHGKHIRNLLG